MSTTTISSKGQITLPASVLREQRLTPGTRLEVISTTNAIVLVRLQGSVLDAVAGSTGGIYSDAATYVARERNSW